jgi:3'5'-cyclic nucleotide phosphodiesterase
MSVNKLLGRIVAPQLDDMIYGESITHDEYLHDHTYGIKSDPLIQFVVVLAALIHDVDHPGVSNGQLIKEQPTLGRTYQHRSVAEQHSVNLAWNVLVSPEYEQPREAIFTTQEELCRFRQVLVNAVIATDIFDGGLISMRKTRWDKAFDTAVTASNRIDHDRKATVVLDHLIQASDVAHTMQHWHVYQKWNQLLFDEMLQAYRDGRSDKDPSDGWYEGELGFFDFYIIPLAKKLKDCGVFGVSSDECLSYALQNRSEWAEKGQGIVKKYVAEFEQKVQGERSVQAHASHKVDLDHSVRGMKAQLEVARHEGGNSAES